MKTSTRLGAAILLLTASTIVTQAQEKKDSPSLEKGQMKVVVVQDENGKQIKLDTTLSIEDRHKIEAILQEKGIHTENGAIHTQLKRIHCDSMGAGSHVWVNNENDGENKRVMVTKIRTAEGEIEKAVEMEVLLKVAEESARNAELMLQKEGDAKHSNVIFLHSESGENEISAEEKEKMLKEIEEQVKRIKVELQTSEDGEQEGVVIKMLGDEGEDVEHNTFVFRSADGKTYETISSEKSHVMVFITKKENNGDKDADDSGSLPLKIEDDNIENLEIEKLKLFPNPNNGLFNMSFNSAKRNDIQINITDIKGRVVYQKELKNFKGQFNEDFDLSAEKSGVYFFNLISGDQKDSRKIILK